MKKFLRLSIFLFVLACLAACAPGTPTASPQLSATATKTLVPSRTFAPTTTRASARPSRTPTITPTPLPLGTLSNEGPWRLVKMKLENGNSVDMICDADGTNCGPIYGKDQPFSGDAWFRIAPSGGRVAILEIPTYGIPVLHILQLPDREWLAHIELIGSAANAVTPDPFRLNSLDFLYFSTTHYWNYVWSPDGRYLAFPGALDAANTDIYLFDTLDNSIRRLTSEEESVQVSGWSPDGQWLIYATGKSFETEGADLKAAGALHIPDGRVIYPFFTYPENSDNAHWQLLEQWISDHSFLMIRLRSEMSPQDLRYVDLSTGQVRLLITDYHLFLGMDVKHGIAFILFHEGSDLGGGSQEHEYGVYRLDLNSGALTLLRSNDPKSIQLYGYYYESWDRLILRIDEGWGEKTTFEVLDSYGNSEIIFDGNLEISPDGAWAIVTNQTKKEISLYNRADNQSQAIHKASGSSVSVKWLPDSSGFYISEEAGNGYLCSKDKNWVPVEVVDLPYILDTYNLILP
ncbi:MAG TPA: hypothetical protein VFF78_05105 [Anaerolineaceae bacterium]|nr:hypothetical protein [Anaerolineaceae bacterium]